MAEALKRRIGVGLLTAYGVGVMVGAGIYVLVGAVAAEAGIHAPWAFLLAGVIAAPTALSYAEFSTRIPEAAGEAAYVEQGLGLPLLGLIVGLGIVAAGTISASAVLSGGVGYLTAIVAVPEVVAIVLVGLLLAGVAIIGVLESLALAAVFTAIEVIGLLLVVWAGFSAEPSVDTVASVPFAFGGVAAAAVLAFFAFIGFEDIVNMAEEVENPLKNMPRAILYSLVIATSVYALVSWAAVRAVPIETLSESRQPLALVWQASRGGEAQFLSAIAVFAALNGVLAQIVMASRVLFGLGRKHSPLAVFNRAHPKLGTPVLATLLIGAMVILGALALPLATLAEVTSSILLSVFVIVNISLVILKRRQPDAPFRVPMYVPVFGFLAAGAALIANLGGVAG